MTQNVGYGPLLRINGPPPIPPIYSLLGTARVFDEVDGEGVERWINGVQVHSYPPDVAHVWDPCSAGSDRQKVTGGVIPLPQYGAYVVYVTETCTTRSIFGESPQEDWPGLYAARAAAVLAAVESAAIEREFMGGHVMRLNPYLADGNGTFPNADAATNVVNTLALLENEIALSGRMGYLHCTPGFAVAAAAHFQFKDVDGVIRTINGTPVVPGFGYAQARNDGVAPHTHAAPGTPAQEWVYATGPVEIRRSPAELLPSPDVVWQAVDRANNVIEYRAERYYLVEWDTAVQAAVLADRCRDNC